MSQLRPITLARQQYELRKGTGSYGDSSSGNQSQKMQIYLIYRMFNLKVNRQLRREYFTPDAMYNGSAGMTFTTTCAGVGKTVAGEGRTGLGHSY